MIGKLFASYIYIKKNIYKYISCVYMKNYPLGYLILIVYSFSISSDSQKNESSCEHVHSNAFYPIIKSDS